MGVALYRKYRSRRLDDVVGQDHVTGILKNAIKHDRVAHAYLFTGPRGVGKTSIARILAHEINNLAYNDDSIHLDIIEIDAASNNGVEDIRDLRERVQSAPVSAKRKVYIIDEVHMLSKPAFNALLKTLEEPPEHVVFILATTDVEKVPDTILSRTQRHSFKRASSRDIAKNLQNIAKSEKISVEPEALKLIARHADGSFRDSVSLFDQLASGLDKRASLTADYTRKSLGLVNDEILQTLIVSAQTGNIAEIQSNLQDLEQSGVSAHLVASQLTHLLRGMISQQPELLPLLDALLSVAKSSVPEAKLLTVLGLHAVVPVEVAQSLTPAQKASPAGTKGPKKIASSEGEKQTEVISPADIIQTKVHSRAFEWNELLEHVKTHHVALHSVLCKCEPIIDGSTLVLYTKSAFYKKKLDMPRYRALLTQSLNELGFSDLEIDTRPTSAPLKDSHAAKVAAIMGGGEEVSVE